MALHDTWDGNWDGFEVKEEAVDWSEFSPVAESEPEPKPGSLFTDNQIVPNNVYSDEGWAGSANQERMAEKIATKGVRAGIGMAEIAARQDPKIGELSLDQMRPDTQVDFLSSYLVKEAVDVIDMFTDGDIRKEVIDASQLIREDSARILGDPNIKYQGNAGTKFGFEVMEAAVNMGGALMVGYVTRNRGLALGVIGGQVGGETYQDYMTKTKGNHDKSMLAAKFHVVAEVLPETIPVFAMLRKSKVGEGVTRMLEATIGEGVQEMLTSILTQAYDNKELENMTLKEAILGIDWSDVLYEGAIGVFVGATLSLPGAMGDYMEGRRQGTGPPPDTTLDEELTPDFQIKTIGDNADVIGDMIESLPELPKPSGDVVDKGEGWIDIDAELEEGDGELKLWAEEKARELTQGKPKELGLDAPETVKLADDAEEAKPREPTVLDKARAGDKKSQKMLSKYDLGWEGDKPKYRLVGQEEADKALAGEKIKPTRNETAIDVTDDPDYAKVPADSDRRIKFKQSSRFDTDLGADADVREKNAAAGEYQLIGEYSLEDIETIDQRQEDGTWKTIYGGKEKDTPIAKPETVSKPATKLEKASETISNDALKAVDAALAGFPKDITDLSDEKHDDLIKLLKSRRDIVDQIDHGLSPRKTSEERSRLIQELHAQNKTPRKYATIDSMREQLEAGATAAPPADEITPTEVKAATEKVEPTGKAIEAAETFRTAQPEFKGLILSFKPGDKRDGINLDHFYGEIADTEDADSMPIDVILSKDHVGNRGDGYVFIVNQYDTKTKKFNQHKVMAGFDSIGDAESAYYSHYGDESMGGIFELKAAEFQEWLDAGDHTAEYAPKTLTPNERKEVRQTKNKLRNEIAKAGGSAAEGATANQSATVEELEADLAALIKSPPLKSVIHPSGNLTTIFIPATDTEVKAKLTFVSGKDLIASHDIDGNKNPSYPEELQPRDRKKGTSRIQIGKMANNLKPELLADSGSIDGGSPIIGVDGVVESGNGRTLAILKAYKKDKAKKYLAYLRKNAESYGLKRSDIKAKNYPILVRVRQGEMTLTERAEFARLANESGTAPMTPAETAKADAARITDDDMLVYAPSNEGNILATSNRSFLTKFGSRLGDLVSGGMTTADGNWTKQFADRVQAAIFYKAYENEDLLALMAEEADPGIKNILAALGQAAPAFARARSAGEMGDLDLISDIVTAIELIKQTQVQGASIDQLLNQEDMFGGVDPAVGKIAKFIEDNIRSAKKLGEGFSKMAAGLETEMEQQRQEGLFDLPPISKSDLVPESEPDPYPTPNENGTYSKDTASKITFPGKKSDKAEAETATLEIGPDKWISAANMSFHQGNMTGVASPLFSKPVYKTQAEAERAALKSILKFAQGEAKTTDSVSTAPQRKSAEKMAAWAEEELKAREADLDEPTSEEDDTLPAKGENYIADYYATPGAQELAHSFKDGDKATKASAITKMAQEMAPKVKAGVNLIPMPSRTGEATDTLELANAISKITGNPVKNILRGNARESVYDIKKRGGKLSDINFSFRLTEIAPKKGGTLVIDSVYDSGETMKALFKAVGGTPGTGLLGPDYLVHSKVIAPAEGFVYHATFTKNVKKITKEGITPMTGASNWTAAGDPDTRYNEDGGIFAFGSPVAAFRWALKMQFDLKEDDISIVKVKDTGDWGVDPAAEMGQFTNQDKSLKKQSAIKPEDIVGSMSLEEFSTGPKLGIPMQEWLEKSGKMLEDLETIGTGVDETLPPGYDPFTKLTSDNELVGKRVSITRGEYVGKTGTITGKMIAFPVVRIELDDGTTPDLPINAIKDEAKTKPEAKSEEWVTPFAKDEFKPGDRVEIIDDGTGSVDFTDDDGKIWVTLDTANVMDKGVAFTPEELRHEEDFSKRPSPFKTIDDVLRVSAQYGGVYTSRDDIKLTADTGKGKKKIKHTAQFWLDAIDERIKAINELRGCAK